MPQVECSDAGTQSLGDGRDTCIDEAEMQVAVLCREGVRAREVSGLPPFHRKVRRREVAQKRALRDDAHVFQQHVVQR